MPQEPITLKISADVEGLNKALTDTAKKLDAWSKGAMGGFAEMAESVGKLAMRFSAMAAPVAVVGAAIYGLVKTTADAGNEFLKLSKQVGVSVEDLSALKYAAEISDTSFDALTTGLGHFSKSITEAGDGTGDAGRYFKAFGISVRDSSGNLKSTRELLLDVADVFSRMPDGPQKTAWAMQLFGKGAKELIPLLNEGKTGINNLMKEAERLGVVFSKEAAEAADRFGDNLMRLKANVMGLVYVIGNELIPAFNNLYDAIFGGKSNWEKLDEVEKRIDLVARRLKNLNENTGGGYGPSAYNADARERLEKELTTLTKERDALRAGLTHTGTGDKKEIPVSPEVLKQLEEYRIKLASVNMEKLKAIELEETKALAEAGGEKALKATDKGQELLDSIRKYYSGERFKVQSEEARVVFDALLKEELAYLEKSKTQELEANKTRLAELEAAHTAGEKTEKQYLAEKLALQAEALWVEINYAIKEKESIEGVWNNKKALIKDEKEKLKEEGDVKAELLKKDEAIAKAKEEAARFGIGYSVEERKASEKLAEAKRQGELTVLEAEIEAKKKLLVLSRERGDKTELEVKREELDLELQLLYARKRNLEVKKNAFGVSETDKAAISAELEAINQKIQTNTEESLQAAREAYGTFWEGMRQGFAKYNNDTITPAFRRGVEIAQAAARGMEQAFSDFFFDAMTGKLKTLWDYVKSFLEAVTRAIANVLAQRAMTSIIGGVTGIFGSGAGAGTGSGGGAGATVVYTHSGGLIAHSGGLVPRFHFGGLSADEVPIIAQKGERIFSIEHTKVVDGLSKLGQMLTNGSNAPQTPTTNNIHIYALDPQSFADYARRNPGPIIQVVNDNLRTAGSLRDGIRKYAMR